MKKSKLAAIIAITLIICVAALIFLQLLVTPKYVDDMQEGSMISEYYDNAGDNDIIFFGDCEAYEVITPVTLWENYGITSYVRGSAQQMVWLSYYLMEDTLNYEKPEIIVFSVCDMMHADPDSTDSDEEREAYNRMTIDGMPWSITKYNAIQASMTSEEREKSGLWSYVFPILRFHDRIFELEDEDWKYLFSKKQVTDNGYLMQVGVSPVTGDYPAMPLVDYTFSDMCYEYLDRMVDLCEQNDIKLVLMKSPSKYPIWYDEYETQIEEYADANGLLYINLLEHEDEIGLDWSSDTYDAGLHLNVYGAQKVTDYIGKILKEEYNLSGHTEEKELSEEWASKVETFDARLAELEDGKEGLNEK